MSDNLLELLTENDMVLVISEDTLPEGAKKLADMAREQQERKLQKQAGRIRVCASSIQPQAAESHGSYERKGAGGKGEGRDVR